ncbi:sortase-associated OmpA-like protein PdsO [Catenovulum sediminis]|uniref:Sortase-associated OmpA-like protein PdsO n=1 Tax=Catenovulum sediminis TaxID=1740262 RepID=A0ABV1RCT0_9ALTE|nr:sortase-associated OmpA-like protein PdsO [Catenovulum sediminis]
MNKINKSTIAILVSCSLGLPAFASEQSRLSTPEKWLAAGKQTIENAKEKIQEPENVGLLSGGSLGALVAGPLGAVIGATIGGLIGHAEEEDDKIKTLTQQHQQSLDALAQLNDTLHKQKRQQVITLRQVSQQIDMLEAPFTQGRNIQFQVQFKTGSSDVTPEYQKQLVGISRLLHAIPDLKISLDGFADNRGGAKYNQQLALERAQAVAQVLQSLGVETNRIKLQAIGELTQAEDDLENNFFQRRVTVTLAKQHAQLVQSVQ